MKREEISDLRDGDRVKNLKGRIFRIHTLFIGCYVMESMLLKETVIATPNDMLMNYKVCDKEPEPIIITKDNAKEYMFKEVEVWETDPTILRSGQLVGYVEGRDDPFIVRITAHSCSYYSHARYVPSR